jgi:peptide methionine sulfoxide reductase MsrA
MEEFIYIEEEAMENGYNVVVGNATIEELLEDSTKHVTFPFDPSDITMKDIHKMETYFASIDEFEKSIQLRDIRDGKSKG